MRYSPPLLSLVTFLLLFNNALHGVVGWRTVMINTNRAVGMRSSTRFLTQSLVASSDSIRSSLHQMEKYINSENEDDDEESVSSLSSTEYDRRNPGNAVTKPPVAIDHENTALHHIVEMPARSGYILSLSQQSAMNKPFGFNPVESIESSMEMMNQMLSSMGIQHGYGYAIILTTIAMKIATLPLSLPQIKSSARLQRLQAIQNKVMTNLAANDANREEILGLLAASSAQVSNPVVTTALSLLQMPITMSVQNALNNLLRHGNLDESFLWIPNLQGPVHGKPANERWEWITSALRGKPKLGWKDTFAFLSLPILQLFTQLYSQKILAMTNNKDSSRPLTMTDQQQVVQTITQLMPFFYTIQNLNAPSAMLLHWIMNHFMTTTITVIARAQVENEILPEEIQVFESSSSASHVQWKRNGNREQQEKVTNEASHSSENHPGSKSLLS